MIRSWTLSELQHPLAAQDMTADARFRRVSTDTRKIKPGDLFVALSGERFDGNQFVQNAAEAGAVAAVVSELQDCNIPQLLVADTLKALGQLAALNRAEFNGPVAAITGSSGKTSVKEMLAAILRTQGQVLATKGNFNNAIGAPLTLLELSSEDEYAVIELGASAEGEIAYTVMLTQPDVALLNNAGGAHLEGFGSLEGVVRAKGEIFSTLSEGGAAVVNLDDAHADVWMAGIDGQVLTFGVDNETADINASDLYVDASGCYRFTLNVEGRGLELQLNVMGRHMVANAAAAAAAATALGIPAEAICSGLESYVGVKGRLDICTLACGARLIDDSYNANPDSVRAAINVLSDLPGERILVLGNLAELGDAAEEIHRQLGAYAHEVGIHKLLTSGDLAALAAEEFTQLGGAATSFTANKDLGDYLLTQLNSDTVVVVKGSRSSAMDTVVSQLQQGEDSSC